MNIDANNNLNLENDQILSYYENFPEKIKIVVHSTVNNLYVFFRVKYSLVN